MENKIMSRLNKLPLEWQLYVLDDIVDALENRIEMFERIQKKREKE